MSNKQVSVLGNLRVAGAVVMDADNTDFPSSPKPGTLLMKGGSLFAYTTIGNVLSWYPLFQNLSDSYLHTQAIPSLNWSVNHNFGSKYYWYQIQDTDGNIITEASRTDSADLNTTVLHFTEAVAGTVLFVGPNSIVLSNISASLLTVGDVSITTTGIKIGGLDVLTALSLDSAVSASVSLATAGLQTSLQTYADNGDATTLAAANGHADYKASQAAGSAKIYTDSQISSVNASIQNVNTTLTNSISATNSNLDTLSTDLRVLVSQNLSPADVVDNLFSTAIDKPLSANQGKILNDAISAISSSGGGGTTGSGETSYTAQFVGDFYPVVGEQRIYPRNAIVIKDIFAWISAVASTDIVFAVRVNGAVVATGTIALGNLITSVTCDVAVATTDYITVDVVSGQGKNLSVRLDF